MRMMTFLGANMQNKSGFVSIFQTSLKKSKTKRELVGLIGDRKEKNNWKSTRAQRV